MPVIRTAALQVLIWIALFDVCVFLCKWKLADVSLYRSRVVPVHAKKARSGSGGRDPLILKQDIDGQRSASRRGSTIR